MTDPLPVTVITDSRQLLVSAADTALIRLSAYSSHRHENGQPCPACAMRTDIRALLFDLLEGARQGLRHPFTRVVIDASAIPIQDKQQVIDALHGRLPARALRDHIVARRFYLAGMA